MAVAKARFPLDEIAGILGKVDRSVGREQGLALCISSSPNSSILSKKTKKTTTRSPAQQERAKIYCDCDHGWAALPFLKGFYTCTYRKKVQGLSTYRFSWYLCWMSMCMADAWNENLFVLNSYVSRYVIKNTSGAPWSGHKVRLINIPTKQANGWDVAIQETDYKRLPQNTLEHKVDTKGSVIVCLPDMAPGRTIYVDVYSYGDYSTPQNCPGVSVAEIDAYLLQTLSFPPTFYLFWDVDINHIAPLTGYLYLPISIAPLEGSVNFSGFNINTGSPVHVGVCDNKHGILDVDLFRFGPITAGQPITAGGKLTRNNSQKYDCDCPSVTVCLDYTCGSFYTRSYFDAYPGGFSCCAGEYMDFRWLIVQGETFAEISPESTIKIGPT